MPWPSPAARCVQMRSKLRRGGEEYLMSPRIDGGSIAVTLGRKDLTIVAVRVQVTTAGDSTLFSD